jgi:hypothetical protein
MQDSSRLTIILCSSVITIVISQKKKLIEKTIIITLFKIAPENRTTLINDQ